MRITIDQLQSFLSASPTISSAAYEVAARFSSLATADASSLQAHVQAWGPSCVVTHDAKCWTRRPSFKSSKSPAAASPPPSSGPQSEPETETTPPGNRHRRSTAGKREANGGAKGETKGEAKDKAATMSPHAAPPA